MGKLDLLKKGTVAELKERKARLRTKIKNRCETITVNAFFEMGIEKIDVEAVLVAAQELRESYSEYQEVSKKIAELEG